MVVDRAAPFIYDRCTGIVFPIHTSVAFARMVGLPDIIYQGTALLARAAAEIVDNDCGGDPTRLKEISCRFKGFVIPPTTLRMQIFADAAKPGLVGFRLLDANGRAAVDAGWVRFE